MKPSGIRSWQASSDVAEDTSAEIQELIDRLRDGDPKARRELLERTHDRLLRIAARIFREDFPGLHGRHDLESVVSEVWMRLVVALDSTVPQTVNGFFGLVFTKVRQVLLDMARGQRRGDVHRQDGRLDPAEPESTAAFDRADTTHDPGRLALLTEFHEQIAKLPDDERRRVRPPLLWRFLPGRDRPDARGAPQAGQPALAGRDGAAGTMAG